MRFKLKETQKPDEVEEWVVEGGFLRVTFLKPLYSKMLVRRRAKKILNMLFEIDL